MKYAYLLLLAILICAAGSVQASGPVLSTLPDGIRLVCESEPSSNLVAITVFIQAGSAEENYGDAGIGSMVADSLLTGTTNQDSDTIATAIGSLGGNIKAIWEPDVTQIRFLILPNQFSDAIYLLQDVLKNADFPSNGVENARQDLVSRIQAEDDDVFGATNDKLRQTLYAGTPFQLPQIGTDSTVNKLTRSDLLTYFNRYYRPDDMLISVVGNIDPRTAQQELGSQLADFVRPPTYHDAPVMAPDPSASSVPIVLKSYRSDVSGALMLAGYLAPGVGTADYPAMVVANALLGGMKTSLMFKNLRTKDKYGYEVASNYTTQIGASDVTGYILYSPMGNASSVDETALVKSALVDQFKQLIANPPSVDDLARAKKFVIGSYLLAHERIEDRAYYLGYAELADKQLGGYTFDTNYADAINTVTAADVQQVAKKYFSGGPVISILLPGDPSSGVTSY